MVMNISFRLRNGNLEKQPVFVIKGIIVALAYSFLLTLARLPLAHQRQGLLRFFCPRTGEHCRQGALPLYRLRWAFSLEAEGVQFTVVGPAVEPAISYYR